MQESNIIYSYSNSILSILSSIGGPSPQTSQNITMDKHIDRIRREAERFYLWSRSYRIATETPTYSPETIHIQFTVLSRLYELGIVIKDCLLPCLDCRSSTVDVSREIYGLETGLGKLLAVLLEGDHEVTDYNPPPGSSNDEAALFDAIEDIQVLIDCLMELSLATDDCRIEYDDSAPEYILSDSFGMSSQSALTICRDIHDRFPLVPRWLVKRFGEAYSTTSESFYKAESELASVEAKVPERHESSTPIHQGSHLMTHGTSSSMSLHPPGQERFRTLGILGTTRKSEPRTCPVCSQTLNNITSLSEWK